MSQIVTRKGPVGEDKEKGQATETPVKEMKKKMAANAEKEKQAAEKHAEKDKDKEKDKPTEKQPEKADKNLEKPSEKKEKAEKSSEKKEKQTEKEKGEKNVEKKSEAPADKQKEDKNAAKPEKADDNKDRDSKEKDKKRTETPKPKQNGARSNGLATTPAATANGEHSDATVSSDEELVIIDHERDDMFPELAYEDSDGEFEPPTPEGLPSRSYTRRSQAKAARTPETPRPASDKRGDKDVDDSKESKVLKLKDDTPSTDRKLRSSDSPKPESKKTEKGQEKKSAEKEKEIAKEADTSKTADKPSPKKKDLEVSEAKDDDNKEKSNVEIIIDVDIDEGPGGAAGARKESTNYSRSRVKVSPYRRATAAVADQTTSSVAANYTGNNTTMEMDITESSSFVEESPSVESPYLSGLRSIRGRRSYKPLKEMTLRNISVNRSVRSTTSVTVTEQPSRPTAPVVGRKRKPEGDDSIELATAAHEAAARSKRARLLDKLARPFRTATAASTPLPARRNAEIVGINTDLPLTAPVAAATDTFDPETLKATTPVTPPPGLTPGPERDRDNKRCSIM